MRCKLRMLCSLVLALVGTSATFASPLNGAISGGGPLDPIGNPGPWIPFQFGGTGSFASGGGGPNPPWTFSGAATFRITDAFLRGDQFSVFDNGVLIGTTPAVPVGGGSTTDPDVAFADPLYSHASFQLGGGNHSITIQAFNSPFGGGGAFFRVLAPETVPEPFSMVVFGGLLAAGGLAVRRRMKVAA